MAGRHWLAPILANWKAGIQAEDAAQEKIAQGALESKIEQEIAAGDAQVRQDCAAAIARQIQAVRDELAQMESRLRDTMRAQGSGPVDGDGRAPHGG